MNFKISFLFIAQVAMLFLISCTNGNIKKEGQSVNNVSPDSTDNTGELEFIDTIYVKSARQITGEWEDLGKETLTVDITKNTISYREHHESYKFKIKTDSIYIYYPDLTLSGRPYLIKDTFVISTTDGEDKYLRLKK
jgi:hypothetical protein